MVEKLFPDPFLKNQNWAYFRINSLNIYEVLNLLYIKLRTIKIHLHETEDHLLLPHIKLFQKTKGGLELVSLPHLLHDFWRKMLFSNFIVWLPLFYEILDNMCTVIVCEPGCDVITFEINLAFQVKSFFSIQPKSQDKNLSIFRTKRAFKAE